MIKHYRIFLFISIGLIANGCFFGEGSNSQNSEKYIPPPSVLDQVLQQKKLTALLNNSPSSYYIYKGEPVGYEYEMLQQFSNYLGVKLEIKLIHDIEGLLDSLQAGIGNIAAANLTVTSSRQEWVNFSSPLLKTKQVLIQRFPDNVHQMTYEQREKALIRDVTELSGKTVHVRSGTSFEQRIKNLNEEIGGGIIIQTIPGYVESDSLLNMVSSGSIDYTLADENLAKLFKGEYRNIDTKTPVSFSQNIAWALAKEESNDLMDTLNYWLSLKETKKLKSHIYNKYYRWQRKAREKINSPYNLGQGGVLSEYDSLLQSLAIEAKYDWKFLAAIVHKESQFDPNAVSWSGAIGLMQILPSTATKFGIDSTQLHDPIHNLKAGTKYLKQMENYWRSEIIDTNEAVKFALASYNVGLGHIKDARRLAEKHNLDPNSWDNNVAQMVVNLSNPTYYKDDVVLHGYCRGKEPFQYVSDVLNRYQHYSNFNEI